MKKEPGIYVTIRGRWSHAWLVEVFDDGRPPHRGSREPGADISDLPPDVQATISAAWTPEVVQAWQDHQAAERAEYEAEEPIRQDFNRREAARDLLRKHALRRFVQQVDGAPGTPAELQQAIDLIRAEL